MNSMSSKFCVLIPFNLLSQCCSKFFLFFFIETILHLKDVTATSTEDPVTTTKTNKYHDDCTKSTSIFLELSVVYILHNVLQLSVVKKQVASVPTSSLKSKTGSIFLSLLLRPFSLKLLTFSFKKKHSRCQQNSKEITSVSEELFEIRW